MNRKVLAVAAIGIFAALLLGSPLGATPAAKKLIRIDSRVLGIEGGTGQFFLALGTGGDFGKVTFMRSFRPKGEKDFTAPDGQVYFIATERDTLKGKNGTIVIRSVGPAYSMGIGKLRGVERYVEDPEWDRRLLPTEGERPIFRPRCSDPAPRSHQEIHGLRPALS
jgi:hypothetical protein